MAGGSRRRRAQVACIFATTNEVARRKPMSRESDWAVFEKACEITASAVRGTMTGADGQQASYVADVFRAVHGALSSVADTMPNKDSKPGF